MKKIIAIVLVMVMIFALVSCGISRKPEDLKEKLEKKYEGDVVVALMDSKITTAGTAVMLGLDSDDIDALLTIALKDVGSGTVIYFESAKEAKEAKADLLDKADEDSDVVIKVNGKALYVGEKDLWKKIKGV